MGWFNIGKRDEHGKQRRIEHRGKYLRASRTGGVALRAQARAAGVTVTANTKRGMRLSVSPAKNTQVALQNGRLVLRGRYGKGPTKLNLSKSGATVSTRNRLGSFNWLKPNRSSAKLFGVQVRGKKAAQLQSIYMVFAALIAAIQLTFSLIVGVVWLIGAVLQLALRLVEVGPHALQAWQRRRRTKRLARAVEQLRSRVGAEVERCSAAHLRAALLLALTAWGRGERPVTRVPALLQIHEVGGGGWLQEAAALEAAAADLERWHGSAADAQEGQLAVVGLLARSASQRLSEHALPELLFELDDWMLAYGARTVLQERMLEVFGDFAGLQLQAAPQAAEHRPSAPQDPSAQAASRSASSSPRLDINTASAVELEAIAHIGPERASAIIALRPITRMSELRKVDGIGPQRLAEIERHAEVRGRR